MIKSVLKILAAVLLVVGSFGGGMAFERSADRAATEMLYVERVQEICKREGIIFVYHYEDFNMYFRCVYIGDQDPESPLI